MKLMESFKNEPRGWHVSRQLLRSGTSVSANAEEADCALTQREFAQFCNIARREAAESRVWLRLAIDFELAEVDQARSLLNEADELVKVLSTIVRKTRAKSQSTTGTFS